MLWPMHPHIEPLPPCQNYDSTGSLCGWLWTQGYNLNCKKIKQFLISSIATALLLVLTFIFISVTSHARVLFFYTLHSLGVMTSHFMHFALLNLLRHTSCFHLTHHKLHGVMYCCWNLFKSSAIYCIAVSESKPPFSKQSYRDYIWSIIWNGLMNSH